MDYAEFLYAKTHEGADSGFDPTFMPDKLFDFQKAMVEYAVRKGRAALFEDCGLGKTFQFLTWAQNIVEHTNGRVLILAPLAVSMQTKIEAEKLGVEVERCSDGRNKARIPVTNYQRIDNFDPSDFDAVVCDESSILKSFDGALKTTITTFMRKVPYRLLATATAAPNDYIELGTSSEALGYLGAMDMLNRFFVNDQNNSATRRLYGETIKWRFKGHAELPFWRWVCSWARALRKPSDLGFDDGPFVLPPLVENRHLVEADTLPDDMLFPLAANTLPEQRAEKRRTIRERCEQAAQLVDHKKPSILWCQLNDEGDLLEQMVPGAVQIAGKHSDEQKEERLLAFINGEFDKLVTKQKICGFGMNFQHCDHMTHFPSHSYEQYYQAVRRCWRFGQKNPVTVDIIHTEGERKIIDNLTRKSKAAEVMFESLVAEMNNAMGIDGMRHYKKETEVPAWL